MIAFTASLALALSAQKPVAPETLARHFVEQLAAKHFAAAGNTFSDQMKSSLPPGKLELLWATLRNQKGAYEKIERISGEQVDNGTAELVTCRFAKAPVTFEVYVDDQRHIGGFFLTPASVIARRFVNLLAKSDFDAAAGMFDAKMREALPVPRLGDLWNGLTTEGGKFDGLDRAKVVPAAADWAALVSARFDKKDIQLRVVVDGEARIVGFFRE